MGASMTMPSIGGAFTAATSFFALGRRPRTALSPARPEAPDAFAPISDGFAPGGSCFEAVAAALVEAGYRDA